MIELTLERGDGVGGHTQLRFQFDEFGVLGCESQTIENHRDEPKPRCPGNNPDRGPITPGEGA